METIIKVLNVGKGDSIIVNFKNCEENFVALIDGGEEKYSDYVFSELSKVLTDNKKEGPDLVICSHYDSDHIAGLIELTRKFGNKIKLFWIHRPDNSFKESLKIINEALKPDQQTMLYDDSKRFKQSLLGGDYKLLDKAELVIESLLQLECLIDLIDNLQIINEQPFADKTQIKKWIANFELVGPTEVFYNQVKSGSINYKDFALKESYFELNEERQTRMESFNQFNNPCDNLKTASVLSESNRTSTIIRLKDSNNTEYLLTADADIEAINDVLTRCKFSENLIMQIPHHGSLNNLSKNILDLIKPKVGLISADGSKHHPHIRITNCLSLREIKIYSTNINGTITINNGQINTEK